MLEKLKEWLLRDFSVPKSEGVQFITILILTILTGLLAIGEFIVDLRATTLPLILSLFGANITLLILAKRYGRIQLIGNAQLLVLYLMFQFTFFSLPNVFHAIIYWMPSIPLLALIFGNLRTSHIWLVVILVTLAFNASYGSRLMGGSYQADIPYLPYAIAASIFTITLVACFSILYNLLGKSYSRLMSKNREVVKLIRQLKEMNGSLEESVRDRTKDIEERNEKLKRYAFMNSHMVRAPLANILGAVKHLDDNHDEKKTKELMDIVKISANSLDDVIKEIGESLAEKA